MRHSPKSVYTLIGAGMRIAGDVACTGVLRVQGDILGNVNCDEGDASSLIVDGAGSIAGTVSAARIEVRGRIVGPVRSQQVVEIFQGGSLTGDVSFRELAIHAGGVLDGQLAPVAITAEAAAAVPRQQQNASTAAARLSQPGAETGGWAERLGGKRKIAAVLLACVAVGAGAWIANHPNFKHSGSDVALKADAVLNVPAEATPAAPAASAAAAQAADTQEAPKTGDAAASPAPEPVAVQEAVAAVPPESPPKTQENVVTVRGTNPSRPPGVFLLISSGPSVLYRKTRDEAGEGDRITVPAGEKASVAIAPNELIRVAQGRDVVILYQGRKVPRDLIDSGAWMSFVPR